MYFAPNAKKNRNCIYLESQKISPNKKKTSFRSGKRPRKKEKNGNGQEKKKDNTLLTKKVRFKK